jgi:hypothetical protein
LPLYHTYDEAIIKIAVLIHNIVDVEDEVLADMREVANER